MKVLKQDWDALHPTDIPNPLTAFEDPSLISQAINDGWNHNRGALHDAIVQTLGAPGAVIKGQTFYDIKLNVPEHGELTVAPGNPLGVGLRLNGWYLEFTSTQPTPAGKEADPRFSVTFDVVLQTELPIPSLARPLAVVSAVGKVEHAKIDSHGTVADAVLDFCGLVKATFGKDFVGLAEAQIEKRQVDLTQRINQALAPLNQILSQLLQQGYQMAEGFLGGTGPQLALRYTRSVHVSTTGPGEIRGTVRWPVADGHAKVSHRAGAELHTLKPIKVTAKVQTAMPAPMTFSGPYQPVGKLLVHETKQVGDTFETTYTLSDLPLGMPITLSCEDVEIAWEGDAANQARSFVPDQWSGAVLLKPHLGLAHMKPLHSLAAMHEHVLRPLVRPEAGTATLPEARAGAAETRDSFNYAAGRTTRPIGDRPELVQPNGGASTHLHPPELNLHELVNANPSAVLAIDAIDFKLTLSQAPR